jgi:hypothetical protein
VSWTGGREKVQTLLTRAERDPATAQTVLQEATGWLERRVVTQLVAELPAGAEHLRELQFRHAGLADDYRAPAAAVAALAWLRAAEAMLEGGMKPQALPVLVAILPTREEAEQAEQISSNW